MNRSVYVRLSIMMFMQYAVWGVWAPTLAKYLGGLDSFRDYTALKINMVYLTMAIASMLSPFIAGQLVDRYFSTERFLAFSHFVGGLLLFWAAQMTDFWGLFWIMLGHSILYAPTVPLTNSLSFHHLPDAEKEFGAVRLWGTIGWIAIGWGFSGWLALPESVTQFLPMPPSIGDCLIIASVLSVFMALYCLSLPHTPPSKENQNPWAIFEALKLAKEPSFAVLLVISFLVSTELQFYYVLTPNFFGDDPTKSLSMQQLSDKAKTNEDETKTLVRLLDLNRNNKLTRKELEEYDTRVSELAAASAVPANKELNLREIQEHVKDKGTQERSAETIALHILSAADENQNKSLTKKELDTFLKKANDLKDKPALALEGFATNAINRGGLGLSDWFIPIAMSLGQICEILVLIVLPLSLTRIGFRWTIAIGIAAWSIRYALFALGTPVWLVLGSQTLHGFGFGFFFVGAMIYTERIAPKDIRASAQSLLIFVTFGAGMLVSSLIAGPVADFFLDWHMTFLIPVAITALCTIGFVIGFKEKPAAAADSASTGDSEAPTDSNA